MAMIPHYFYFCAFIYFFKFNCHKNILLYTINSLKLNVTIIIDCSSKIISNFLQDMETSLKIERYVINNIVMIYLLEHYLFCISTTRYILNTIKKLSYSLCLATNHCININIYYTYKSHKCFKVCHERSMSRYVHKFLALLSVFSNIISNHSIADIWTFVSSSDYI